MKNLFKKYNNGEPCPHKGRLNHMTHPCEGCGRTVGRYVKHILVFSPCFSHPQIGGNIKYIHNICKTLKDQGHEIHFIWYKLFNHNIPNIKAMAAEWNSVEIHDYINIPDTNKKPSNGEYFTVDEWFVDNFEINLNFKPDIVIANYVFTSKIFEYFPDALKILLTHDKLGGRAERQKSLNIHPDFFYTNEEQESIALNRADRVIAITNEEKEYFSNLTNRPVYTVSHIEESNFIKKDYKEIKKIGFIGSFSSMNIEGLKYFLNACGDLLVKNNISVHLVGGICNALDRFTQINKNLTLVPEGFVDNLDSFYEQMDCFISTPVFGDGQNIKSVEAISRGVPLIATESAFKGIDKTYYDYRIGFNIRRVLKNTIYNPERNLKEMAYISKRLFEDYNQKQINNLLDVIE